MNPPTVLRNVALAGPSHRLQRPSGQAAAAKNIAADGTPAEAMPAQHLPASTQALNPPAPASPVTPTANLPVPAPVKIPAPQPVAQPDPAALEAARQQGRQQGHDAGIQEGLHQARQEAQQQIEKQAEKLAHELSRQQVRQALAQAEQQAHKATQHLQAQLQQQCDRLGALLQQLPAELSQYLDQAEDDMLALVYEVVCRVLGDEAASLPGLRSQLQRCLKAWHGHAMLSLHLHPDDLAALQADEASLHMLQAAGFSAARANLRWVADPKVTLGGCQLRSAEGALDARLDVQLQALKTTLLNTRASRRLLAAQHPQERTA